MADSNATRRIRRLKNELRELFNENIPGIYTCPDPDDEFCVHALIIGPPGTPYEKGMFYFIVHYPPEYPLKPPTVKFMTTGSGRVRFNPNLYNCGKVCLSILGTWTGPSWASAMTTQTVLLSIQSLLNEEPFYNEPGEGKDDAASKNYNDRVRRDTIEVAVLGMVENATNDSATEFTIPDVLKGIIVHLFFLEVPFYRRVIEENMNVNPIPDGTYAGMFMMMLPTFRPNMTRGLTYRDLRNKLEHFTTTKQPNANAMHDYAALRARFVTRK